VVTVVVATRRIRGNMRDNKNNKTGVLIIVSTF
jgi:hypothetical protein